MKRAIVLAATSTVALAAALIYGTGLVDNELCGRPECFEYFFGEARYAVGILGWWISAWGLVIAVLKLGMAERSLKDQSDSASTSHAIAHFQHFSEVLDGWVDQFVCLREVHRANVQVHARIFPQMSLVIGRHGDGSDTRMVERWAGLVDDLNSDWEKYGPGLPGLHERKNELRGWCRWAGFFVGEDLTGEAIGQIEQELYQLMNSLMKLSGNKSLFPEIVKYR